MCGFGKAGKTRSHERIALPAASERHQSADCQPALGVALNAIQPANALKIDDDAKAAKCSPSSSSGDPARRQWVVRASSTSLPRRRLQQLNGFTDGGGIGPLKRFHAVVLPLVKGHQDLVRSNRQVAHAHAASR